MPQIRKHNPSMTGKLLVSLFWIRHELCPVQIRETKIPEAYGACGHAAAQGC